MCHSVKMNCVSVQLGLQAAQGRAAHGCQHSHLWCVVARGPQRVVVLRRVWNRCALASGSHEAEVLPSLASRALNFIHLNAFASPRAAELAHGSIGRATAAARAAARIALARPRRRIAPTRVADGESMSVHAAALKPPDPEYALRGHLDPVTAVRFVPRGDELFVASGDTAGRVKLWDLSSRRPRAAWDASDSDLGVLEVHARARARIELWGIAATPRGPTWIFRGAGSRRRRGVPRDIPRD